MIKPQIAPHRCEAYTPGQLSKFPQAGLFVRSKVETNHRLEVPPAEPSVQPEPFRLVVRDRADMRQAVRFRLMQGMFDAVEVCPRPHRPDGVGERQPRPFLPLRPEVEPVPEPG